jgi:hypothetical protein
MRYILSKYITTTRSSGNIDEALRGVHEVEEIPSQNIKETGVRVNEVEEIPLRLLIL